MLLIGLTQGLMGFAHAGQVDLTSMLDHEGDAVLDPKVLGESYRQLVMELGTLIANKHDHPVGTVGTYGFDVDIGAQFVLTEARDRLGEPSPWARANVDEISSPYSVVPTFTVRKGLPLSTEVGASLAWIGGTQTGVFGGFARLAVLEGYKPLPDVALKVGYSGYVGNDDLDCSTLDMGVSIGSRFPVGRIPGANTGHVAPFASFTTLRVRANASLPDDTEAAIGALRYASDKGGDENALPPISFPAIGAGVQFVAGNSHLRVAGSWAWATVPTVSTGFGFTF